MTVARVTVTSPRLKGEPPPPMRPRTMDEAGFRPPYGLDHRLVGQCFPGRVELVAFGPRQKIGSALAFPALLRSRLLPLC